MLFKNLLNLIFPKDYTCASCGRDVFNDEYNLCNKCKNRLTYLSGNLCLHCGEPLNGEGHYCIKCKGKKFVCDRVISPFKYEGIIKSLILGLKYENKKYNAKTLAYYMADAYNLSRLPVDVIIPVPLHKVREKKRGYNQAMLIARHFGKSLNKPVLDGILVKIKETPTQTKLSNFDRRENIKGAFKVTNKKLLKDKVVVIVDDVYTTGATIDSCCAELRKAKVKAIYAVTAAHTVKKSEDDESVKK